MRVAIAQSNYIPWRGYFDLIDDVDLFIIHDDIQYTKGDWRNRNKIKTREGLIWLSVPVQYHTTVQRICETCIDYSHSWQRKHVEQIKANYSRAPFYHLYADELGAILREKYETISDLNLTLMRWIMKKLSITTPLRMSSEFTPCGRKTDRVVDILRKVGATGYLSGPAGKAYLEPNQFAAAGIDLEYKAYVYGEYPQLWGRFEPAVTVLDLLFNCGGSSRGYLKSLSNNERITSLALR